MLVGALPPALISLLLVASRVSAAPYDFLDNYRDPTPAADEGPPASYQAVRDKNVLPYEICGVVGGYVFTVLIWGVLLLTVGRKMRRKALDPPKQLELELQDKPTLPALRTAGLTSPPLSARSFFGKFKRNRNDSAVSNPQSPVVQSPSSFDQKVLDAHRGQDQADMERLYAAVMDFDERKHSSKVSVEETEPIPRPTERRRPSNISIARPESHSETPISPVKAIYPPNYSVQQPAAPTHSTHLRADAHPPPSPRSILSKRSQNSNTNSTGSKNARFNLKNLRISGPIAKYPGADSDDEARTPLSPRFYANPGVPPSPPTQTNSPTSPEQYTEEALDSVQPLPRPAPQRLGPPPTSQPPSTSTTRQHPPKPLTSQTASLPLRSFASPLASPGIQTTVLDRRVEALALGTPKTGVPFTPYSPYMPFTPITPVTPHLTTRKERKMEKKEGRKYGSRRPRVEEELVQSPKEIFGDGW